MNSLFADWLADNKPLVNQHLNQTLKDGRPSEASPSTDLYDQISILVSRGGKRLRPLLCLLAYQGYGGKNPDIVTVAVSQEFLHAFLLAHDDIIDRDTKRWGGPNIIGVYHRQYRQTMSAVKARQLAEAQGMLAGDILFILANQQLLINSFPATVNQQALAMQQSTVQEVIAGEAADMAFVHQSKPDEADILRMYIQKTASYSFRLPMQLGALYAGAPNEEQAKLQDISVHLGIAFQLQDDLLGMFGSPSVIGKSNLSDLREGKRTLLVAKAIELANPAASQQLQNLLTNPGANRQALLQAQEIITASGAKDYIERLSERHINHAAEKIANLEMSQPAKIILQELINQLRSRRH